jgi:hypothetical protein
MTDQPIPIGTPAQSLVGRLGVNTFRNVGDPSTDGLIVGRLFYPVAHGLVAGPPVLFVDYLSDLDQRGV